jgi:polar amino acid transport system substrate-binding protein
MERNMNRRGFIGLSASLLVLCGCASPAPAPRTGGENAPKAPGEDAPKAAAAAGGNLARIQAAKIIRIGVKADSPPFGFTDAEGNPQGFDIDLGFRVARALNVQPVFVTVTSGDRIEKLNKGEVDVILATLTGTRKRAKELDFSMPYYKDQQMLLVKAESPLKSYRDLDGKTVAALNGSTSIDNIKTVAPGAKTAAFATLKEAFEALNSDKAEVLTGDGMALRGLMLSSPTPKAFRIAGEGFSEEPFVIGLPRNDSDFRAAIDDALQEIWHSGTWTRIFNKWLGPDSAYNLTSSFEMPVLPP